MLTPLTHCKINRTSEQSKIKSILKENSLRTCLPGGILIGSRAARELLPNFRGVPTNNNTDWDIIGSSSFLLNWLKNRHNAINTIDMITPVSNDDDDNDDQLDLYIYCTLIDGSKYDFLIPRSSTSYTAYILDNSVNWIVHKQYWELREEKMDLIYCASAKLLLILKKYMLYYSHQWEKTAKDYRELLAVTSPLTADDMILCDLFIRYNEKIYGKRPPNTNEFVINSTKDQKCITINRDEFFQHEKDKQISFIYKIAMSLSFNDDILIGLEHICTQGPSWLVDYVIENWIVIQQEKFKQTFQLSYPCIKFQIENYRLFPNIPEIPTKRILHFINDSIDLYSMQLVCKQWYTILRDEIFWQDLYISRYGTCTNQINNIQNKTSDHYSVRLIIIGLEHERSRSKIHLNLRVGEYGGSRFTDHMEQLSIRYESNTNEQRSLIFLGPELFGFHIGQWGYVFTESTYLGRTSSTLSDQYPSGLLICLFIMMVHPDHRAQFINQTINPYRFPKILIWAQQGKYFNFLGYPIFYYDSSVRNASAMSKPTLLLLHGYPTSSIDWLYMRDELEQRFHIIAPDYIGYGLSAKPISFPYTISSQVNMIEQLMNSLNLNQFHIMAHDVGDTIAQEFLARQIDDRQYIIQSIVFLNGGLFPEAHRPFFMMKMLKTPIIGVIIQYIVSRSLFSLTINRVFGPSTKRTKQELDEITDLLFYNAPYNLIQQLQCYINERIIYRDRWVNAINKVQKLEKNPIPIRMINGPFDPISGKHMVDRYREIIINPDICLLDTNIGHYPNLEDPENTLKHFFDFHNSIST
ncbi:unnamed protein product [Rotaria sordida]|uniref:F-box domain-containing protein n=1 Tax=Rotaria sordida TaxID=392033 RepID=A0A814VLF7_9BILA|nr:unnamed protein product [Rotaria sordida]